MNRPRMLAAALTISAAGLAVTVSHEGFTDKAVVPVKGDRPTYGHGSTWRPDGTPVQLGDTITREDAAKLLQRQLRTWEVGMQKCVKAPVSQVEYDILVDFSHQYGVSTACTSSVVLNINAGNYEAACRVYPLYKYGPGWYDCSTPGNRVCPGVHTRNLERQAKCLAAQ